MSPSMQSSKIWCLIYDSPVLTIDEAYISIDIRNILPKQIRWKNKSELLQWKYLYDQLE